MAVSGFTSGAVRSYCAIGHAEEGGMERRRLGGLEVSAVGLGCATMTPFYDAPDPASAIATIHRARELGVDFLDTADGYARGHNEELIAQAVAGHRSDYAIASKFGNLGLLGDPRGRGFLTGGVTSLDALRDGDARRIMPRFQGDNLARNLALVEELKAHATAERCTPAQLAIAWLLSRRPFIVPIPGTSHVHRLEENAAAAGLRISADTADALDHIFAPGAAAGDRYPANHLQRLMI